MTAARSARYRSPRHRQSIVRAQHFGLYLFLFTAALFFSIPLLIMISTSLKTAAEVRAGSVFALPVEPGFAAWTRAWGEACIGRTCEGISAGLWNSVIILIPSTVLSVGLAALNGYALSLWNVPRAGAILAALLLGAFIPYQVMIYPLVRMASTVGIYGSLPGIVAVHVIFGIPVLTLIFCNFYKGLPPELIKAARVDGAGFFRIFRRIVLPMSGNIIIVALILSVTGVWNDYLLSLIFAGRDNLPMTVQLASLVGTRIGVPEYNVNMAATLITALPPLLLYLLSGKYFVRGVTAGAIKG
ncbi:carbohydrate ABC transporter permease [Thalassorhabdomicrobium marinisediminis]|uniref:Sugar ABC transporter permease n=1 Tax=Thalassorhabdomicrobium marinisediminis TaxID=2170577 RepID=A0A2T7FTA0_9RHOB|nr:carbohydrate ABC transporter permease [Thalassorhabdomicrobium marinisediminis]PVA05362.1 sugar ABC transporter permease [Thalassorhabdomicrobium marinisediminis]